MQVTIEFYRTRAEDDAHAVLDRVVREVTGLEDAIELARSLAVSLDMPQVPDAVLITNSSGEALCSMTSLSLKDS